jgi:hypothetical protein
MVPGKVPPHQPTAGFRLLTNPPRQQQAKEQTVKEDDAVCEHHCLFLYLKSLVL